MILNMNTIFLLSSQIRAGPQIKTGAGPPVRAGPTKSVRISQQQQLHIFLKHKVRRSTMQYFNKLKVTGIIVALVIFAAASQTAMAAGTSSNTTISNTADVDYQISGANQPTVTSAASDFLVDNRVDLTVTNVSGDNVVPNETDQPLTFTVTNDGNTSQGYSLAATNGGGDFNMTNIRIYIEDGTTAGFQIAEDTLYVANTNAFDLIEDATSVNVYVVSDTPGTPTDTQTSDVDLRATTLNVGTAVVTTATAGADTPATVDVVLGDAAGSVAGDVVEDGTHSAVGTYTVAVTPLTLVKSSTVTSDPFNLGVNPKRIPGATIQYTLVVSNPGGTGATNVIVVDAMPANTTYTAGTITVGGAPRTDIVGDGADYNVTNATSVTVNVGALAAGANETITFDVTID